MTWFHQLTESLEQSSRLVNQRLQAAVDSRIVRSSQRAILHPPVVFLLATLSFTTVLGYRFYNSPRLDVGKIAPQTIYAPGDAEVEDKQATEEKRKTALNQTVSVLMLSPTVTEQVQQTLQQSLQQGTDLRQIAGSFPVVPTAALSRRVQSYLRQAEEEDWLRILASVQGVSASARPTAHSTIQPTMPGKKAGHLSNQQASQALSELQVYRRSVQPAEVARLLQTLTTARNQYLAAVSALPQPSDSSSLSAYDSALFDLTDAEWQQTQVQTQRIAERMLAQGIPTGLPPSALQEAVQLNAKQELPAVAVPVSVRLLMTTLQPNLIQDEEQSRFMAEQAAREVKPEMIKVSQGDLIVKAGDRITSNAFAVLDYFKLSRRGVNWTKFLIFGGLVSVAIGIFRYVERRFQVKLCYRDRLLIGLLTLSTPSLLLLQVPSINLPAVGLLIGSFYGSPVGVTVTGLLTVLLALGMNLPLTQLLSSGAGGLVCGLLGGRLRTREEQALLGASVGVLQAGLYLVLNLTSGVGWYVLLTEAALRGLAGLTWCIVAIGISPYLEQLFDLVTTVRLVELANPNRPLLKKLAAETPGTFQHTLFVATLAEAAARHLGCNVELVRSGTLYHDIGKMHDPLGFIENQMGGPNKHDQINDPWISADIIKKHVTEGLVMARKFRLPKAVQAFIPEHQGTMQIAYFYHQAQQLAQQALAANQMPRPVLDSEFRYDGPIPQSRETGIVMLADSCEAALRSLKDATPETALSTVNKILRARWQDNQLVDSGLTREELTRIAEIFVEVWQQFHHQRIAYPKAVLSAGK